MTQEVKYKGYTAQPSDYESTDGELSLSLGLIQEDGALKPIMPPSVEMMPTEKIIYIHEVQGEKNYITSGSDLGWIKGSDESYHYFTHSFSGVEVYQVTSIGNTLVVLAEDAIHYFLYKRDNSEYKYLGTKIPECALSFGLQGEMRYEQCPYLHLENAFSTGNNTFPQNLSDYWQGVFTDKAMAEANKFIAEVHKDGRFVFPFLVRYAYRLYDGSLTMHSSPVLMIAATRATPMISLAPQREDVNTSFQSVRVAVYGMAHQLDYQLLNNPSLEDWNDIVKSVDVFVSKPIYTLDINGKCEQINHIMSTSYLDSQYCVAKHTNQLTKVYSTSEYPIYYQKKTFRDLLSLTFGNPNDSSTNWGHDYHGYNLASRKGGLYLVMPERDSEIVNEEIKNCGQFYFLKSIKFEELSTIRKVIDVQEDYLNTIVTREVMTDEYNSHDSIISEYAFPYNSRLNICNLRRKLFGGYHPSSLLCYYDLEGYAIYENCYTTYNSEYSYYKYINSAPQVQKDANYTVRIYTFIKENGKEYVVKSSIDGVTGYNAQMLYLYYPNINAYKSKVYFYDTLFGNFLGVFNFEQHNFLNGSVAFNGFYNSFSLTNESYPTLYSDIIPIQNKIYTSEINNPFVFPALGINTIGFGKVNAICAATKALSEGQFGQFPLYAFTSDGVWALEVSNTGTYSSKQPITREVCTNVDSITQIDTAVLFATNRGIMLLSGSTCVCISDSINNLKPFTLSRLPSSTAIIDTFNSKVNRMDELRDTDVEMLPFLDFIKDDCRMVYDYTNQHIVVYKPDYYYAYVYSMKSKQWGMMRCDFESNVNSYPESLVMGYVKRLRQVRPGVSHIIRIRALLNLSIADSVYIPDEDGYIMFPFGALLVTRPFDFEQPDVFKTIDTIIQRGNFPRDKVQQVLYGSNDLQHWFPIWSSVDKYMRGFRGTPYKAFRLAVIAQLEQHEDIDGFSVQFTPRLTNQLR